MKKKLTGQQIRTLRAVEIVGALLLGIVLAFSEMAGHWLTWPVMILLVGLVIVDIIFCRCPHCGRYLRIVTEERCFCPYCGKEL